VLEVDGLVRAYGPVRALDHMTFAVEAGSVTLASDEPSVKSPSSFVVRLSKSLAIAMSPTAILAMPVLYAIDAAALWAVVLSMAMTAVAVVLVAMLAAKIYERSVLRTGRKVSSREALHSRSEIEDGTPLPAPG
jgi:hypothetical protein